MDPRNEQSSEESNPIIYTFIIELINYQTPIKYLCYKSLNIFNSFYIVFNPIDLSTFIYFFVAEFLVFFGFMRAFSQENSGGKDYTF